MSKSNGGMNFIDDRNIWKGNSGWWERIPKPQRPTRWKKHPLEIRNMKCFVCRKYLKAIMSWSSNSDNNWCVEKWICKCGRISQIWQYNSDRGWRNLSDC